MVDDISWDAPKKPQEDVSWEEPTPTIWDVKPEAADHGLSERQKLSPLGKAISPITGYWDTYKRMNAEARAQAGRGYEQITNPDSLIKPEAHGISDVISGVGNVAAGGLGYALSPGLAAYRSVIGQPLEDTTGIPREIPEFAAQLATPGIGLTKIPGRTPPPVPVRPTPNGPLGVTLSEGQRTHEMPALRAESAARTGQLGPTAEQTTKEFYAQQAPEVAAAEDTVARSMDPAGGQVIAGSPYEAAEIAGKSFRTEAARAKAGVTTAYKQAEGLPGEIDARAFNGIGNSIKNDLSAASEPVILDPQLTPFAVKAIDAIDETISKLRIPNRAEINPPDPADIVAVNLKGVDQIRKKLSEYRRGAYSSGNATDGRAASAVIDAFDARVDQAINGGMFNGDPAAVRAWNNARAAHADYKTTFGKGKGDPVGNVIQKIIGDKTNPAETANALADHLYGASGVNPSDLNIGVAKRMMKVLGVDSPEWAAVRQGLFQRLVSKGIENDFGSTNITNRLNKFLKVDGKDLAAVVFTPQQRKLMQQYADLHRQLEIPKGGYNSSETSTFMAPLAKKISEHVAGALGAIIGGTVVPGMHGAGAGAGAYLGSKGRTMFENAKNARIIEAQMPIIARQMQQYQKQAARLSKQPTSRAALALTGLNLSRSLDRIGANGAFRQLAPPATADQNQQPATAGFARGGSIKKKDGGSVKGALRDATDSFGQGGMPGGDTTDFYSGEVLPADDWADREAQANLAAQGEPARGWGDTWQGIKDFPSRLAQHDPNAPPSETFPILDKSNIINAGANLIRGGAESIKSGVTAAGRALSGEMPMWDQEGHTSPEAVAGAFDAASLPVGGGVVTGLASAAGKPGAVVAAAEHAPRFYSHLEKTVEDLPFKTGTADQLLGTLTNKGVKQAELEATGTLDYLASKGGEKVTKDELLAHIAQNKVELKAVEKGAAPAWEELPGQTQWDMVDRWELPPEKAREYYEKLRASGEDMGLDYDLKGTTKFSQYQLPGGSSYKEKLLTLPVKGAEDVQALEVKINAGTATLAERQRYNDLADSGKWPTRFQSSHWDEPNVLAHTRSNERNVTGVNGGANDTVASHHIEEIQSDWHQKGRKQGYESERKALTQEVIDKEKAAIVGQQLDKPDVAERLAAYHEASDRLEEFNRRGAAIPDAPFKSNWHELAIKDALSDAVAAGKTRISWTPGEAQAARYDLSKHLDKVQYHADTQRLVGIDKSGGVVLDQVTPPEKIPDYIGKDVAEKLLNSPQMSGVPIHQLENADLKVGGEFHKKLYDQKVPQVLNKIGKAHGVKVERGTTAVDRPGYDIVSQDGRSSYATYGSATDAANRLQQVADQYGVSADTLKVRKNTANEHPVHYMDIPPSLADQIRTKGFSLFEDSSAGAPIAALEQTNSRARDPALWHGISDVKLPKPISEMSAEHVPTNPVRETSIRPADLQGSRLLPLIGDRSAAGSNLTRVNGFQFGQPVEMQGGHGFMPANVDTGAAWASGKSVVSGLSNKVKAAAETGPVHGVYTAMGERSVDFSHHVSDTLSEMLKHTKIGAAGKQAFNEAMRRQDANFKAIEDWPGLNSKNLREYLASAPGEVRNKFAKTMDTRKFQMLGFPSVAEARFAVTDPRLLHEPTGAAGLSVAQLDPTGRTFQTGAQHRSYDTNLAGKYVGGLPTSIPKELMYPDILKAIDKYRRGMTGYVPTSDYLMARTPKGLPLTQKVDQKWVDSVSKFLQNRGHSGLARGGKVTKKKLLTSSALQTAYAMKRQG